MTYMTVDTFEHIAGSTSSDPWYLAERYGISKRAVDMIQMGRISVEEADGCTPQQIDDLARRELERLNTERTRAAYVRRRALTELPAHKSLLARLRHR